MTDTKRRVEACLRPEVAALKAYAVPNAAGMIKLDAMENPFAWPGELPAPLVNEWLAALRAAELNRYPDPQAAALKERLRETLGIPRDAGILLGNGSDELIQIALLALAKPGASVLAPTPTFVMYEILATAVGMRFIGVPLTADFHLDLPRMLETIAHERPAVIFLAYPNNPTGNLFDVQAIEAIVRAASGLVIIDEAYAVFAEESFLPRLREFGQVLVMRTVSKQGLAGLRLGLLAGDPLWLEQFDKLRLPYNVNTLTQVSVEFALRHNDALLEQASQIRAERERVFAALAAVPGVRVWPSRANFILFRLSRAAGGVFAALKRRGVLIKNLDHAHPMLEGCLRVTVGKPAENDAFLAALAAALNE